MGRQTFPAPGVKAVRGALDAVRVTMGDIGKWLAAASNERKSVPNGTLNNYRDGRREMPAAMRKLLAKQLRRHADRLRAMAKDVESLSDK